MAAKKKKVSDAAYTQMQELGSAWVFKRAIRDNIVFNSADDILNDKETFKEIQKIWRTIGKCEFGDIEQDYSWVDAFYKQQKTLFCLLYTSPSPRDATLSRMPSSA